MGSTSINLTKFEMLVTSVIILAAGARCVADLWTGPCELSEQVPHHQRLGWLVHQSQGTHQQCVSHEIVAILQGTFCAWKHATFNLDIICDRLLNRWYQEHCKINLAPGGQVVGGHGFKMLSLFVRSLKRMPFSGRRSWTVSMMSSMYGLMSNVAGCTWMVSSVEVLISRLCYQWKHNDFRGWCCLFALASFNQWESILCHLSVLVDFQRGGCFLFKYSCVDQQTS